MRLEFLRKNQNTSKIYKRFTIKPFPEKETVSSGKTEFFYIGNNSQKIDFLLKTFECGYAAETVGNAISILKRIAEKHKTPDVIIIDSEVGELPLKELNQYISGHISYSLIPVVLDASGLPENELKKYRNLQFLDEIIFLDEKSSGKLISKIEFLKKVKKQPFHCTIRENFQKTVVSAFQWKYLLRRVFDIIVSFFAIILLSPLFVLIACVIKLESRGPIFYISKRAGRGYRIFNFFKFRTMVLDADKKVDQLSHLNHYKVDSVNGPVFFKVINDTRVTKVGVFLRNTSMDELPQFFNVLLGNMSLVGNRPLPLYEAAKLTTDEWAERFMAPAGITGLWQIKKKDQEEMTVEERIELDIAYAHKCNFMYDLWIMANTPSALIQKPNA